MLPVLNILLYNYQHLFELLLIMYHLHRLQSFVIYHYKLDLDMLLPVLILLQVLPLPLVLQLLLVLELLLPLMLFLHDNNLYNPIHNHFELYILMMYLYLHMILFQ